jgi:hypothetical protein
VKLILQSNTKITKCVCVQARYFTNYLIKLPNWYTQPVEQKALEQINAVHKVTAKENVCISKTVGNNTRHKWTFIKLQSVCAASINYVKGNSHVTHRTETQEENKFLNLHIGHYFTKQKH